MFSLLKQLLNMKIMGVTLTVAGVFMVAGVIFWGGFNWSMEMTNTEEFCISCHEMEDNVYQEYKKTVHYSNRSGVRATCPDCHVPKEWTYKIKRKIQASNELWHKMLGTIDTREKFESKRLHLAMNEWKRMKSTDSRECRNCHSFEYMHQTDQKPRALKQHTNAVQKGNTCIDCHKGIAHQNVRHLVDEEVLEELEAPDPALARPDVTLHLFEREKTDVTEEPEKNASSEVDAPKAAITVNPATALPSSGFIDWAGIATKEMTLLYPGTASIEWIHKGSEHGGKRPFMAGDRCVECHDAETADMGQKMVTGEKLEDSVIPGKRGSVPLTVQAAHDEEYLYLRLNWTDTEHAPVAFVDGGKMDPENPMKVAFMIGTDDVKYADRAGCWGSCHVDVNNMPGEVDAAAIAAYSESGRLDTSGGLTKYLAESRTKVELKGRRGKVLGGWDKLKTAEEIQSELEAGNFLDLVRYNSGTKTVEDGYILDQRKMSGGQGGEVNAQLIDGQWIVEFKRKLTSGLEGDIQMSLDQVYNIGFAIHEDYSNSRFHHVSLGYRLGFDNTEEGVEINAIKK